VKKGDEDAFSSEGGESSLEEGEKNEPSTGWIFLLLHEQLSVERESPYEKTSFVGGIPREER